MGRRVITGLIGIGIAFMGYSQVWVSSQVHQGLIELTGADLSLVTGSLLAVLVATVLIWSYLGRIGRMAFAIAIGVIAILTALSGVFAFINDDLIETQLGNRIGIIGGELDYSTSLIGPILVVAGSAVLLGIALLAIWKPLAKSSAADRIEKTAGDTDDPIGMWDSQR